MSALTRALGTPEPAGPDADMLRRLERAYRRVEPDPLFERRLRGEVLNRFVAAREGHLRQPSALRRMGGLGRAVLYASLGLAIGVSATGAVAADSLPGDPLYAVKLQLEELRMRIAPPSVHNDLVAMALSERVGELERLAAAGSWRLVPAAAARVSAAEEALLAIDPHAASTTAASQAISALEAVLAGAPPQAQAGLERALEVVGGTTGHRSRTEPGSPAQPTRPDPARPTADGSSAPTAGPADPGANEKPSSVNRGSHRDRAR